MTADFLFPRTLANGGRVDEQVIASLASRGEVLRVQSTKTVAPIIRQLEQYTRLLVQLFTSAEPRYSNELGKMAAESAWLTA